MKIYESFWKKLQDSARKGKIQECPDLSDLTAQNLLQPSWCSQNSLWLWNYHWIINGGVQHELGNLCNLHGWLVSYVHSDAAPRGGHKIADMFLDASKVTHHAPRWDDVHDVVTFGKNSATPAVANGLTAGISSWVRPKHRTPTLPSSHLVSG